MLHTDNVVFLRCPHDKKNPYVMVSNALIRDASISPECRWLIIYLLTNQEGFTINIKQVINHLSEFKSKSSVYVLVNEAIDAGYMKREDVTTSKGKDSIGKKTYKYFVSEAPKFKVSFRSPENDDLEVFRSPEIRGLENLDYKKEQESISKKEQDTGRTPDPLSPSSFSPKKSRKKIPEEKQELAERVLITPSQHAALLKRAGGDEALVTSWYERLSTWKIDKEIFDGKGDFGAIIKWVIDAVKKDRGSSGVAKENRIDIDKKLALEVQKRCPRKIEIERDSIRFSSGGAHADTYINFGDKGFREQVLNMLRKWQLSTDGL